MKERESKGAEERGDDKQFKDTRPTYDQLYLASRLEDIAPQARLGLPAIQRLNTRYGVESVTSALRLLRGFPPELAIRSPYAYVEAICKESA